MVARAHRPIPTVFAPLAYSLGGEHISSPGATNCERMTIIAEVLYYKTSTPSRKLQDKVGSRKPQEAMRCSHDWSVQMCSCALARRNARKHGNEMATRNSAKSTVH